MKVYEISTLAKPPLDEYQYYSSLTWNREDRRRLGASPFSGRPRMKHWRPVLLYIDRPTWPKPDIFSCGLGAFAISESVCQRLVEAFIDSGELLPISVEGVDEKYFIFNTTNCINAFDAERSVWKRYGPANECKQLVQPAFFGERFNEECIFKYPDLGAGEIYCWERTADAEDGEFKALVELHKLSGLDFKLVWSDDQ